MENTITHNYFLYVFEHLKDFQVLEIMNRTVNISEFDPDQIEPTTKNYKNPNSTGSKIVVIGKPGCFQKGTKILMYDGSIKNVEAVNVGDKVMGDDSTERNVLELCRNEDRMYNIILPHRTVVVNEKHILSLKNQYSSKVCNIRLDDYLLTDKKFKEDYMWYRVKVNPEVNYIDIFTNCYDLDDFTIEYSHFGEYYGFTTDKNHLFLLDDFSVVHNTGKTTLITGLIYEKEHIYPIAQIYSGTEDSNGFYAQKFEDLFIFNKYEEEKMMNSVKRQKIAKKHLKNPWAVFLLDDVTDEPAKLRTVFMQSIFKNGRHWKPFFILSLQYCMDIKPVIRTTIDYTFILRESNLRNRRNLWLNYASCVSSFDDFCDLMDALTDDYTALVVNNRVQSNNIEDCIFYYKAPIPPKDWKFGCKDYHLYAKERYNSEYSDPL
jgi:hypothetical protein